VAGPPVVPAVLCCCPRRCRGTGCRPRPP